MLTYSRVKFDDSKTSMVHSLEPGLSMDYLTAPPVSMLLTFTGHFRSRKEEMQASRDVHHRFELYGGTCAAMMDVFRHDEVVV